MPESESEQREAQVNLTEATEDPNQVLEEPKASYAQEGKPRSMTYYFQHYATYCFYILVHLSLQELTEALVHDPRYLCLNTSMCRSLDGYATDSVEVE